MYNRRCSGISVIEYFLYSFLTRYPVNIWKAKIHPPPLVLSFCVFDRHRNTTRTEPYRTLWCERERPALFKGLDLCKISHNTLMPPERGNIVPDRKWVASVDTGWHFQIPNNIDCTQWITKRGKWIPDSLIDNVQIKLVRSRISSLFFSKGAF